MQTKTLVASLALAISIAGAETRTATVEDPRPLAKALESLETASLHSSWADTRTTL